MAELLERLARNHHCEVHLYAQRVEELMVSSADGSGSADGGAIIWHKVPSLPGPQLLKFVFWLFLNSLWRWRDRIFHGYRFDCLFSPGINCLGANAILVHAVFHRLRELQEQTMDGGVRGLHRGLYYRFVRQLERGVYGDPRVALAAVSQRTAVQLQRYFGRRDAAVIPNGVDVNVFNPQARKERRAEARSHWSFAPQEQVVLLIGNDWRTKGLEALLEAAALCADLPLRVLVAGEEDSSSWRKTIERLHLMGRVSFSSPSANVLDFLAAADLYVAPSMEDSFNLPVLEAMACGLPVIVSKQAGISEWIRDGSDGVLLQDPQDSKELAAALRKLVTEPQTMERLGENAMRTASALSWDRHAESIYALLQSARARTADSTAHFQ